MCYIFSIYHCSRILIIIKLYTCLHCLLSVVAIKIFLRLVKHKVNRVPHCLYYSIIYRTTSKDEKLYSSRMLTVDSKGLIGLGLSAQGREEVRRVKDLCMFSTALHEKPNVTTTDSAINLT